MHIVPIRSSAFIVLPSILSHIDRWPAWSKIM
jgi:hypothetical protein